MKRLFKLPWGKIRTRLMLLVIGIGFITLFPADSPGANSTDDKVLFEARDNLFNYVAWELDAIWRKIDQTQSSPAPYMTEEARSQYIYDYLKVVAVYQRAESDLQRRISTSNLSDPAGQRLEIQKLTEQRDNARSEVNQREALSEAIIESQISSVLRDEGFGTLGTILPPVSAHITELPKLLIISPRDKIRFELGVNVSATTEINALEEAIQHDLNVSALVEPLGGLGLYPTMVSQTYSPTFLFDIVSHEWSHNYLLFFPLGLSYFGNPESRIINETTASLFGHEMSRKVLQRFYSQFPDIMSQIPPSSIPVTPAPSRQTPTLTPTAIPHDPDQPAPFSFDTEMNKVRVTVDFYLHFGLVDLAEGYMESERQIFLDHGYFIHRLNQAYFAFYGGYQSPGNAGAGGSDPIGPAIALIRAHSSSLKAWMETMRNITTRAELLAVRDNLH